MSGSYIQRLASPELQEQMIPEVIESGKKIGKELAYFANKY